MDVPDEDMYSLEGSVFPFVLNCPPGFDCNSATSYSMVCCGQLLSVQFPANATISDKLLLIGGVVRECANRSVFCGGVPPNLPPPNRPPTDPPVQLYFNSPKACSIKCPDGSTFTYTVQAGTFSAPTKAQADAIAQASACEQAQLRRMCLGSIQAKACANSAYSQSITVTGGFGPFKWEVVDGVLPTGISIDSGSGSLTGTPTVGAGHSFSVRATSLSDGSYTVKTFSICVVDISPSSATLPLAAVGVPLRVDFSASTCASKPLSWQHIGALPAGLVLDETTGTLSGTPSVAGTFTFTIKVQDAAT